MSFKFLFFFGLVTYIGCANTTNKEEPTTLSSKEAQSQKLKEYLDKLSSSVLLQVQPTYDFTKHTCECAVFNTETPTDKDQAVLTQGPINVSCDSSGEGTCLKLCSALAKAAGDSGSDFLCSSVGHYNKLKASVHSRVCGMNKWTYTGLTSPNEICCHEGKVIDCKMMPL